MNQEQGSDPSVENVRPYFRRNFIYKTGFSILFPSFLSYIVAFCVDSWFRVNIFGSTISISFGLWKSCDERLDCEDKSNIILGMQIISLLFFTGLCVALLLGMVENCHPRPANYHSRKVEWTVLSVAFVGSVEIFVFMMLALSFQGATLDDSFFFSASVVGLLFASVGLMACGNQKTSTRQVTNNATPIPQQQPATMTVYYGPGPNGVPTQTTVYNYNYPNPPPSNSGTILYGPQNPNAVTTSSLPAMYPNTLPPGAPPPPYVLPPMYPHQAPLLQQHPDMPPSYSAVQSQEKDPHELEASAPLMPDTNSHVKEEIP